MDYLKYCTAWFVFVVACVGIIASGIQFGINNYKFNETWLETIGRLGLLSAFLVHWHLEMALLKTK